MVTDSNITNVVRKPVEVLLIVGRGRIEQKRPFVVAPCVVPRTVTAAPALTVYVGPEGDLLT